MGHLARPYFTLLHFTFHFSCQCVSVNSSKFNNKSVINVSLIRMYQYASNDNVHINVSNKECSNIDLKLRRKNSKIIERKKVLFINFFV